MFAVTAPCLRGCEDASITYVKPNFKPALIIRCAGKASSQVVTHGRTRMQLQSCTAKRAVTDMLYHSGAMATAGHISATTEVNLGKVLQHVDVTWFQETGSMDARTEHSSVGSIVNAAVVLPAGVPMCSQVSAGIALPHPCSMYAG